MIRDERKIKERKLKEHVIQETSKFAFGPACSQCRSRLKTKLHAMLIRQESSQLVASQKKDGAIASQTNVSVWVVVLGSKPHCRYGWSGSQQNVPFTSSHTFLFGAKAQPICGVASQQE